MAATAAVSGTNHAMWTVPMPGFIVDVMDEHLREFVGPAGDALVFAGADGGALRANGWRARHWSPAIRRAGLDPLRPHDLRHTAVSLWIAARANPNQVAAWAGHTSVSVVLDRYGHLFPGHEESVLAELDRLGSTPAPPMASVRTLR